MAGSNLPPGVSERCIPGVVHPDEAFWDALLARAEEKGLGSLALRIAELDPDDWMYRIVELAKDIASEQAFSEGRDDALMAQGAAEQERAVQRGATRRAITPAPEGQELERLRVVRQYLPANYVASLTVLIEGEDNAGWTMDEYVIPRLASGLYFASEVVLP
jgi:hypothetical protein